MAAERAKGEGGYDVPAEVAKALPTLTDIIASTPIAPRPPRFGTTMLPPDAAEKIRAFFERHSVTAGEYRKPMDGAAPPAVLSDPIDIASLLNVWCDEGAAAKKREADLRLATEPPYWPGKDPLRDAVERGQRVVADQPAVYDATAGKYLQRVAANPGQDEYTLSGDDVFAVHGKPGHAIQITYPYNPAAAAPSKTRVEAAETVKRLGTVSPAEAIRLLGGPPVPLRPFRGFLEIPSAPAYDVKIKTDARGVEIRSLPCACGVYTFFPGSAADCARRSSTGVGFSYISHGAGVCQDSLGMLEQPSVPCFCKARMVPDDARLDLRSRLDFDGARDRHTAILCIDASGNAHSAAATPEPS